ncbi:MAG TPA: Ger(x)C family spore germination protein [Clostridiales bacterium]|nr:Ger(x)C family spore germination protein [Clostridiales bacterium]
MKFIKVLVIVISLTLLTGCWDRHELDELLIPYVIGIDICEDNPKLVSVAISSPSIDETEKPFITMIDQGISIQDALYNLQTKLYRRMGLGHVQVILIGEETAKEGISVFLDTFTRNADVRGCLKVAVVKGRASDFINNADVKQHPYLGIFLSGILEGMKRDNISVDMTLAEFYRYLLADGREPILPYLNLSPDKQQIIARQTAVFLDDRMVGILNRNQSMALMILKGNMGNQRIAVEFPRKSPGGFHYATVLEESRHRVKVMPQINGDIVNFKVDVDMTMEIIEHTPSEATVIPPRLDELEHAIEKEYKERMENVISKLQGYKTDAAGFGEYVRVKYPHFFNKEKWQEDFSKAKFDISVNINIIRPGSTI